MSVVITSQTPFSIHAAAYWAAREAYEKHQAQCQAVLGADDKALQIAYDAAYTPLVSAMHEAAEAAMYVAVGTTAEIGGKIEIILNEDLHELHKDTVRAIFEALGNDAKRIGGAA